MMCIKYICIFSDKLPSHIQTFGLLLILSRFIGLPRYSYQPFYCSVSQIHINPEKTRKKHQNDVLDFGRTYISLRPTSCDDM